MTKKPQLDELFIVKDLETLKVLSDPFRMEILRYVSLANKKGRLVTVKELADALERPPTKLYYHVNLLEKHNLLVVADTQVVSGIIEKYYQIVADNITVDKKILATEEGPADENLENVLKTIQAFVDNAYQELHKSMKTLFIEELVEKEGGPKAREQVSMLVHSDELFLTKSQGRKMRKRIQEIQQEFNHISEENIKKDKEGLFFGFTVIFNPLYHHTPNPNAKEEEIEILEESDNE